MFYILKNYVDTYTSVPELEKGVLVAISIYNSVMSNIFFYFMLFWDTIYITNGDDYYLTEQNPQLWNPYGNNFRLTKYGISPP